jgi:hypothetical protein
MSVICPVCSSTPSIRGRVDADIARKTSLRDIAAKHGLSVRSVQRHLRHLPELLETESPSTTSPSIYIGGITYNFHVCATTPEEEIEEEAQAAADDSHEDLLGSIAEEWGGEHA